MHPWIRFLHLDGRDSGRILWLTTGDVVGEFEVWPASILNQCCHECDALATPLLGPITPTLRNGNLRWYCHYCIIRNEGIAARIREASSDVDALLRKLFPRFNIRAAPGEEWDT